MPYSLPPFSENGIIKSAKVEEVMLKVDRGHYSKHNPYMDSPQSIGYSVTISAPHMVKMFLVGLCLIVFTYAVKPRYILPA